MSFNSNTTVAVMPDDDDMKLATDMHWVSSVVLGFIFVLFGLIGNFLSIKIWSLKSMRSSTGTYLIALAMADIGLLVFFFITDTIKMMVPSLATHYAYGVFFSYIGYPGFFLFVVWSIWLTIGVTVDRYLQVCWSSRAKSMCSPRRVLLGIGIICFLCFVINIPHFCTYRPLSSDERGADDTAFGFTEFGMSDGSLQYEFWVHCMFLVLVPWFSIFVMNMLIINKISKTRRRVSKHVNSIKKDGSNSQRGEAQITRTLLTVTFTFLVLLSFQCITQCFFMQKPEEANFRIINEAFSVAKLGVVINSAINFLLYCMSGRRFRKELRSILTCHGNQDGYPSASLSRSSYSTGDSTSTLKSTDTTTSILKPTDDTMPDVKVDYTQM